MVIMFSSLRGLAALVVALGLVVAIWNSGSVKDSDFHACSQNLYVIFKGLDCGQSEGGGEDHQEIMDWNWERAPP